MFDTAKLEASQRALTHAADVLRWTAAASAAEATAAAAEAAAAGALHAPAVASWLAERPEGLCLALRACVENGGGSCGTGVAGVGERLGLGFGGRGSHHQADATAAASNG